MNYRHAFHAGNFADVFKHAVLARILDYLLRKDAPLRYLDTHSGSGLYKVDSAEARRTGEWQDGVGRMLAGEAPQNAAALLAPWMKAAGLLSDAARRQYPESVRHLEHLVVHEQWTRAW